MSETYYLKQKIRQLEQSLDKVTKESQAYIVALELQLSATEGRRETSEEHRRILAEALAEIKASYEGNSGQPIGVILRGCVEELKALDT